MDINWQLSKEQFEEIVELINNTLQKATKPVTGITNFKQATCVKKEDGFYCYAVKDGSLIIVGGPYNNCSACKNLKK